jgi:sugar O-acyltransferase (sialic acid O-acetyltransferase NeuD family)
LTNAIIGVYRPGVKKKVYDFFNEKYGIQTSSYINLIDPASKVSTTTTIASGANFQPLSVIAPFACIGNFVTINRSASIGHHTVIEDFCTINPGVNIAGNCHIGEKVNIGMGANIIDAVKIGENSIVGAGALVTKDIPANVLVMGVPAKIIKEI